MSEARLQRLKQDIEDAPRRAPVAVVEDMSWEEFSRVNVRAPELPGVTADMGEVRVYPFAAAFSHVVGYVAKVSAKDVSKTGPNAQPILLNPGFRIGKRGVEKAFDLPLRGTPGARKIEVDVKGRVVRRHPGGDVPAQPGAAIELTLDADIQNRGLEVFGDDSGAAVMMDVRNGDLLCLLSAPSFDANQFVKGMTGPDYRALAAYDRKPLFDKALSATYPPGSTFKTMVAMAALGERRRSGADLHLQRWHQLWRPGVPLRQAPRHAGHAQRDQDLMRCLLLRDGAGARPQSHRRNGAEVRPGRDLRHRPAPAAGHRARYRLQAPRLSS